MPKRMVRRKYTGYTLETWLRRFIGLRKEMELMIEDGRMDPGVGAKIIKSMNKASAIGHKFRNYGTL